jgi:ATP-binding cassette subfamily B protein
VRELEPDALWRRIGLVPQKPYLFSGTVASNLRYGKPDATEEEMWEASRWRAVTRGRHAWAGRPDRPGRHQRVGHASASASAIARALVRRRIYLFDDTFSALDLPPTPGCGLPGAVTRTPRCSSSPSGSRRCDGRPDPRLEDGRSVA